MKKQEIINWLSSLIDTSIICLGDEQPSIPHDRLLFQLKAKLKELQSHPKTQASPKKEKSHNRNSYT